MGSPKILKIQAVTDSRNAVKGLGEVESKSDRMARRVGKAGKIAGVGLLALAAGGFKAAKAAAADEAGANKLSSALRKNAGASKASIAATEAWIDKQARAKGIADDELRPALATLVRATGNVAKSQKSLSLAMDIATATGKPLSAVSAALAKGYGGNTAALGKLVPGIDKAILKSGDMSKITGELAKKVGGDAARAAQTNEGKTRRMAIAAGELEEQLGAALLPVLGFLVTALGSTATFLQNNSNVATKAAIVVGALALAVVTINGAYRVYQATLLAVETVKKLSVITTAAQTVAQYALGTAWLAGRVAAIAFAAGVRLINAAWRANPLGVAITVITILAGLFVLAYKRSATFRAIVQATGRAAQAALGWIVSKAQSVISWFGRLGPAANKAKTVAVAAFRLYTAPIRTVINLISSLVGWISRIKFPKVPKAISSLGGLFGGGGPGDAPTAPGGSVPGHGAGGPGSNGGFVIATGGGRSSVTVNITIQGAVDKVGTANQIIQLLREHGVRMGTVTV